MSHSPKKSPRTCVLPTPPRAGRKARLANMWINAAPGAPIQASAGSRLFALAYGLACYAIFFVTFLYAIGFMGNFLTPTSIDAPPTSPLWLAITVNTALILLFGVQHSVMARPWFKKAWTRIVPEHLERSTYVLFSSLALIALFALWQPMGMTIWNISHPVARAALIAIMLAGFAIVLVTTFLINHFDLFGLRHTWLYFTRRAYTHLDFATPGVYRIVRHPLYVGWLLSFWAAPTMTGAHLLFAALSTAYILAAIRWEERDLLDLHGESYAIYRDQVPMLVPTPGKAWRDDTAPAPALN
ncbi:MAG: methyltransferase [Phycisphaerales bacterium]|nr:hypothetical protein [Phycisphaerales bacterium]